MPTGTSAFRLGGFLRGLGRGAALDCYEACDEKNFIITTPLMISAIPAMLAASSF